MQRQFVWQRLLACVVLISVLWLPSRPVHGSRNGWTSFGPADNIRTLAISHANEQIVYAFGDKGFWMSDDGGRNWSLRSDVRLGQHAPILVDSRNPRIVYSGGSADLRGIIWSTDGGLSWTVLWPDVDVTALALDYAGSGTLYAGAITTGGMQILRSKDGGASWIVSMDYASANPGPRSVTSIAIDPSHPNEVYAAVQLYGSGILIRSHDAGAHWDTIQDANQNPAMLPTALAISANSQGAARFYVAWASSRSKSLSISPNGLTAWQNIASRLPTTGNRISSLVAASDGALYAGFVGESPQRQEGGVYVSRDGGQSWQQLDSLAKVINQLALSPDERTLFAGTTDGVLVYNLPVGSLEPSVNARFVAYYNSHDGHRVLGSPISVGAVVGNYFSQYFEKGRIEDHSAESDDPVWRLMFGLLVDDLQLAGANLPVGGNTSTATYATIRNHAVENLRVLPPPGYTEGAMRRLDGSVFVPFTVDLSAVPGHNIYGPFWDYINRKDLFPGGWLHDIGLPITEPISATVDKGNAANAFDREIVLQAFQRTVLTYDPLNPPGWQVERANVGTDYAKAFPNRIPD